MSFEDWGLEYGNASRVSGLVGYMEFSVVVTGIFVEVLSCGYFVGTVRFNAGTCSVCMVCSRIAA